MQIVQLCKKECRDGRRPGKAQASIEMVIAFIGIFVILLGALNLFFWLNQRFILQQRDFENTRVEAASAANDTEKQVDESGYKLDILKNLW